MPPKNIDTSPSSHLWTNPLPKVSKHKRATKGAFGRSQFEGKPLRYPTLFAEGRAMISEPKTTSEIFALHKQREAKTPNFVPWTSSKE